MDSDYLENFSKWAITHLMNTLKLDFKRFYGKNVKINIKSVVRQHYPSISYMVDIISTERTDSISVEFLMLPQFENDKEVKAINCIFGYWREKQHINFGFVSIPIEPYPKGVSNIFEREQKIRMNKVIEMFRDYFKLHPIFQARVSNFESAIIFIKRDLTRTNEQYKNCKKTRDLDRLRAIEAHCQQEAQEVKLTLFGHMNATFRSRGSEGIINRTRSYIFALEHAYYNIASLCAHPNKEIKPNPFDSASSSIEGLERIIKVLKKNPTNRA